VGHTARAAPGHGRLAQSDRTAADHHKMDPQQRRSTGFAGSDGRGIDMSTCSLPEAATLIDAGKVRPLAVMVAERDPKFPDVPTLKEMGIDWSCGVWRGIAAPAGTPP